MAKQIIWSPLAKEALKTILFSCMEKRGSTAHGKMLYAWFQNAIFRITLNPFIGQATEMDNVRYVTPHPDYTLFYRHSLTRIDILVIWDNHHKPGKIKKKLLPVTDG